MTREELIREYIRAQQLLTFEEWYKINENAFTIGKNEENPKKMYEEYIAEFLGE